MEALKKNRKVILIAFAAVVICALAAILIVFKINKYYLELSIPEETLTLEYGVDEMPEVTALCKGTIINKEGTSVAVSLEGELDLNKIGTYNVTYTTEYRNMTLKEKRTIVVQDTVAPVIELVSNPEYFTSPVAAYVEEGFTATDNYDGDVTANVVSQEHDGIVTYTVSDSSGNTATIDRTIVYKDVVAPAISLKGSKNIYVNIGENYNEPGFTASDDVDGDLTSTVTVEGSVDVNKKGAYTLTYKVSDSSGNTATVKRTINIFDKQAISNAVNPGNKVVYLTFDDGPGRHTATLLDILDKYGVKVTFFVTNQFPAYQHMIGEAHRRGHTIALHTYSHVYNEIYSSEEAYYADLQKIHDIVVSQTGVTPTIVRFPGGTSNQKAKNIKMSSLAESLAYHGYLYCDWNVSSGDAGGTKTAAAVANNVISGIQRNNISIVLQHDIQSFSVAAVEQIIQWGLANGYTFLPMSDTTPMVHQKPYR